MREEKFSQVHTNDVFKGYFCIPNWLSENMEELNPVAAESGHYVTIRYGNARTTIYQPVNFGGENLYQLIVKRKKIGENIFNQIEWQEQAFQDKEGVFGEPPPCVLLINVAASVMATISEDWREILRPPESHPPPLESKVVELPLKFWRKVAAYTPESVFKHGGYTIETTIPPSDAECGIYHVFFTGDTFTIEPTRDTANSTIEEVFEWVKSITGWCDDVDRLFGV